MDVEHIWTWFQDISTRRQVGMGPNPISYTEIEAYCRLNLVRMTVWEVQLIVRLDSAVLTVWGSQAPKSKKTAAETGDGMIPTSNSSGIKALFQGLMAKKNKPTKT